jgi:hypothetical protein
MSGWVCAHRCQSIEDAEAERIAKTYVCHAVDGAALELATVKLLDSRGQIGGGLELHETTREISRVE